MRTLDNDRYYAALQWSGENRLTPDGPHQYLLPGETDAQSIEYVAAFFANGPPEKLGLEQHLGLGLSHVRHDGGEIGRGLDSNPGAPDE